MIGKILLTIVIIFFIAVAPVMAIEQNKTILIIPFTNSGNIEFDHLSDLIPTYFYALLKDVPGYTSISPFKIKQHDKGYIYKAKNFDKESLAPLVKAYNAEFVIHGEYKEYDGELIVYLVIVSTADWKTDTKIIKSKIQIPIAYTLDELFLSIINNFIGFIVNSSILSVSTDYPCSLYIDDEYFGETPKKIRLVKGNHSVELRYRDDEEAIIYSSNIDLSSDSSKDVNLKVFVPLSITTEEKVSVYINGENKGQTPLNIDLLTGREFHIRMVYTNDDNREILAYDDILSTQGYATSDDSQIDIFLPAKASITVTPSQYDLLCRLNNNELVAVPHSYDLLDPDNYSVSIILDDILWGRHWTLYRKSFSLAPYEKVLVDMQGFEFQTPYYYCFLPSLSQFHNYEPEKGIALISVFAASFCVTMASAIIGKHYYDELVLIDNSIQDQGVNSPYTELDRDNAFKPVSLCNTLITSGMIAGIITWIYSGIDGAITMNHLDTVLNKD